MSRVVLGLARDTRGPVFATFIVIVLVFPFLFSSDYALGAAINVGAMAIATVGFVLLIGYAHQLAIGQAAFCTLGAYGSALLVTRHGWDPFVALIAAMTISMLVAYIVGRPILRLRGFVLAMASLALQLILGFIALQWISVTGGAIGVDGVPRFAFFGLALGSDRALYFVVWFAVAASVLIGGNIDRARVGRELKAIASSERAASSVGIDLAKAKVRMFVLSAGMASVAGSLTVHYLRLMEPGVFGFQYSLNIITAVVIGGLSSVWGGVLGAAIIIGLREALRVTSQPLFEGVLMGALTIIVLLLFPRGVSGAIADLYRRLSPGRDRILRDRSVTPAEIAPAPRLAAGPASTILALDGVTRSFGSLVAVDTVGFNVTRGSITALIGPNGAGKTTLFNMISGDQPLNGGRIDFDGERIDRLSPHLVSRRGIARTFQNLELFDNLTVLENVMCGRSRGARAGLVEIMAGLPNVAREERVMRGEAEAWLSFVGLLDYRDYLPGALSFGHQRLLEIARALATEPSLILLDEPASGLNDSETEQLADLILRIRARGITLLLVEHDIRLVMGLSDHIVVMNYGKKIAEGEPSLIRADAQVRAAYLGG